MWINLLILGVIASCILWVVQRRNWTIIARSAAGLFFVVMFALASYFHLGGIYLGGDTPWYDQTPFREMALYIVMLVGMFARTISRAIEVRTERSKQLSKQGMPPDKPALDIDWWDLAYPFFFSVITFGTLISQVEQKRLSLIILVLAFQTGFFWQTVLKKG